MFSCQKENYYKDSQPAANFTSKVPLSWNRLFLEVERYTPGYKPPVSARTSGYIGLIAYEAIVHGTDGEYRSFSGYFPGLELEAPDSDLEFHWETALHAAYEKAFQLFFPTAPAEQQFDILSQSNDIKLELRNSVAPDVYQRSYAFGKQIAQDIYDWSANDTWGHEGYHKNNDPDYTPPTGIDLWKPTYPDFLPALLPHWGKVRTFAAQDGDVVGPPHPFSTSEQSAIYQEAMETRLLVNQIKQGEKEEDYWIAEFWSDDCPILTFSPSGRWISITNQLVDLEQLNLVKAVFTYAKVGMALSDAGVKCWGEKYNHNCLRPIDYIRDYMGDSEWNTIMCPDGSGGYYTPNFPTYPSGHATFSAAAAEVLTGIFGASYTFVDRSHEDRTEFRGAPRTFTSFHEMALENAYSRVPLGVHFQIDSDAGTALGTIVGNRVNDLPWKN
ncbi:MAG: hypothetical protein DHS20C18_14890 [Saprospiraceae bacterium]|nr:MAG: hypothetical protein DHS20C18_14890 [Saprospiraceae bacterium]